MGLFGGITSTIRNTIKQPLSLPKTIANGSIFGSNPLINQAPGMQLLGGLGGGQQAPMTDTGIPDFTNQYEAAAMKLNNEQKAADGQDLRFNMGAQQANQRSNLAMRGGLTAGSNERLAQQGTQDFANAYGNMATKYGLGASGIQVDAIKTRQEMELQKAMGQDRVNALRQGQGANPLSKIPLIGGLFG